MSTNQQRREAAKRKLERQQERRGQLEQRRKRVAAITAVVVVVAVVGATVALAVLDSGPGRPSDPSAAVESTPSGSAPDSPAPQPELEIPTQLTPPATRPEALPPRVDCTYQPDGVPAKPVTPPPASGVAARGSVQASLSTSVGPIDLRLDRALAPCTVNSFVSLAQQGYFNGTGCHRLTTTPGLQVLQCGDPTGTGGGGPGYTVPDEVFPELRYGRGLLAMANTGQPNSGGSQFFMIYGSAQLPPQYTVFGTIGDQGLQTIDKIARAGHDGSLDPSPGGGAPNLAVTITTAVV